MFLFAALLLVASSGCENSDGQSREELAEEIDRQVERELDRTRDRVDEARDRIDAEEPREVGSPLVQVR